MMRTALIMINELDEEGLDHDHDYEELDEGDDVDEHVSAGFNEQTVDPVEITVSWRMMMRKDLIVDLNVLNVSSTDSVPVLMRTQQ